MLQRCIACMPQLIFSALPNIDSNGPYKAQLQVHDQARSNRDSNGHGRHGSFEELHVIQTTLQKLEPICLQMF